MSTAPIAEVQNPLPAASEREPALPLRGDNFLGVCTAIGQDLGIHPNWLRVPFAALLLWNPAVVVGTYLLLGCVVAAARWFFPAEQKQQPAEAAQVAPAEASAPAVDTRESEELLAA